MLKAVIFDMDGVLVDSEPLHAKAHVQSLSKLGVEVSLDYCYSFVGSTTLHMLETIKEDFKLSQSITELLELYNTEKHLLIKAEGYTGIPYTKELITQLFNHGIKLAIASSSTITEINNVVEALGIKKYFHKLISGTTVANPKPAPDVFLKAATSLGVSTDEYIIIEDSYNGVCAANAARIPVIGFINPHSGKQDLSKAAVLIEGFEEIDYEFILHTYLRSHNSPITIAQTKRLIIRELSIDDIPKMYQIYQNNEVRKYLDDLDDYLDTVIEMHKAYIKNVYNFYGYGLWGVFHKNTGELIGRCGIQNTRINNRDEIELGYLLDVNHWGFGYAYECTSAVIDYAFRHLKLKRIVALIHPLNYRSIKVAEKIGMTKDTVIEQNNTELNIYVIENET